MNYHDITIRTIGTVSPSKPDPLGDDVYAELMAIANDPIEQHFRRQAEELDDESETDRERHERLVAELIAIAITASVLAGGKP